MKVLVIGAVAGGAGAASRIKRLCEDCEVIVIERGGYVSFANCGLPYHIGGAIPKRSSLLLQTPEGLKKRSDIEVRTAHEAVKINRDKKTLDIKNLITGEYYTESYDTLVIATGSSPIIPPLEGITDSRVKTLCTIPDMDGIIKSLGGGSKDVAVIGGGFIGLETAENLIQAGHRVSLIEKMPQVMAPFDPEMAGYLHEELQREGVNLILGQGLRKIESRDEGLTLHLDGSKIEADFVILSLGVVPNSSLAKEAGLSLNERGGIIVNDFLQTSDPNIYALGDVIETYNIATQSQGMTPLAGPATRQSRIAAENIVNTKKRPYAGVNPTAICKVFSLAAAFTGASEKQLRGNKSYRKLYVHPSNHPSYYPNARQMHIKLLYNDEGTVLGAQVIGGEGTDKRIDIFAIAVRQKLSVYDLAELDLAYAPPFGSPRDPIHIAAFAAINQLEGLSDLAFAEDMPKAFLLDVREPQEVEAGPVEGAYHIPLGQLRSRIGELDKGRPIIINCASGLRSYLAERILKQKGFKVSNFSGGYACIRMIK